MIADVHEPSEAKLGCGNVGRVLSLVRTHHREVKLTYDRCTRTSPFTRSLPSCVESMEASAYG